MKAIKIVLGQLAKWSTERTLENNIKSTLNFLNLIIVIMIMKENILALGGHISFAISNTDYF